MQAITCSTAEGDKMTAQMTVIITGAASGIGKSIAMLFHGRGANVFCVDVNPESLAQQGTRWKYKE